MYFPHTFYDIKGSMNLGKEARCSRYSTYYDPSSIFSWTGQITIMQHCKTLAWAPIAKYWYIIGLWSLTWGVVLFYWRTIWKQFKGHVKVISRSIWRKLLPWSRVFFRAVPISFSNVSSNGDWASVWWHVYNVSIITSNYINLTLCRWAISDNLKTAQFYHHDFH